MKIQANAISLRSIMIAAMMFPVHMAQGTIQTSINYKRTPGPKSLLPSTAADFDAISLAALKTVRKNAKRRADSISGNYAS